MQLKLYNSLSNSLESFRPIDPCHIKMYACGPTVYSSPHIGNARPLILFDVLFRLLEKLYKKVTYVRNITDVDDKINARARERNISIRELTNEVIAEFHNNLLKLNVKPATHEPRATNHINDMLEIIQRLVKNGYAYKSNGHVLFRVGKLQNYGQLSKRSIDDMIAGSRVEIADYKENPMDFVLWKPSDENTPSWDSPFGRGRPGWHVECSAMSYRYLGKTFDIHAGGQDLMFPHHENEMAQNYGAFGCNMANYWIHNGMLLVDGRKMSKSLGNVISLQDVLQKYDGEVIRYVLLSSHYQKTLNWTEQLVIHAKQSLDRLYGALKLSKRLKKKESERSVVVEALCNNLNTPLALQCLHQIADGIYKSSNNDEIEELCGQLIMEADFLGILQKTPQDWFTSGNQKISAEEIEALIVDRTNAKREKDYRLADDIRAKLLSNGIQIEDTKDGTIWRTV